MNMQQMMAEANRIQRTLKKAKDELHAKEFEISKSGMVTVVVMGDKTIKSVEIDKDAIDPENAEMIQDTIVMAINEALEKIDAEEAAIEERITGRAGGLGF